jgi:hypothetical protein
MDYLKKACDMDPGYAPARINLAAVYFFMGEDHIYSARAAVEKARKLAPHDPEIQGLRALIIYREGQDVDMWKRAVEMLEKLASKPGAPLSTRYNLAVLVEERGRSGKAQALWKALAKDAARLPAPFRRIVAKKAGVTLPIEEAGRADATLPWKPPVQVGTDLLEGKARDRFSSGWIPIPFDWGSEALAGHIYRKPDGTAVLDLDDFVEMVVFRGKKLGSVESLLKQCGKPAVERHVGGGTLFGYGPKWAALVRYGKVEEVWISRSEEDEED